MRGLFREAAEAQQWTKMLRIQQILFYEPGISETAREGIHRFLMDERHISVANPSVLEMIIDHGLATGQPELAEKAAREIVRVFTETDAALSARMVLSRFAIEREEYDEAITHLDIIREIFATDPHAADALLTLGEIYLKRGEYEKADEAYTAVMGMQEWRPKWPAALYGRGEISRAQRRYAAAAVYYERIYVMYAHYRDWVARAYLARSQCLLQLRNTQGALEVLDEMLAREDLQEFPEYREAQALRESLKERTR